MILPKKKYIKEGFVDDGRIMEFLDGQFVLDSEGMKELADWLEKWQKLFDEAKVSELNFAVGTFMAQNEMYIRFLRGEK